MTFKPGQSGNPRGGPKKEKDFSAMLRIALKEAHEDGKDNRLRAVADTLVTKAIAGDVPAIKEIADRLDGKPHQSVDTKVDAGGELAEMLARIAENGRRLSE